jgi:hypothetical protein
MNFSVSKGLDFEREHAPESLLLSLASDASPWRIDGN